MKNKLTILIATTLLAGTGFAQSQAPSHDLKSAQAFFTRGDSDGNGQLSLRETTSMGITQRQAASYDANGDGSIQKSEFYVAYRKMAIAGGETTNSDLDNEVARILAARKAAKDKTDAETRAQKSKRLKDIQDKADAETRAQKAKRLKDIQDKADAETRAQKSKRLKDIQDKADAETRAQKAKRLKDAKDKADAKARAQKAKRLKEAKDKADAAARKKGRIGG